MHRTGTSISSVTCKNPSYSGPSYTSSPVLNKDISHSAQTNNFSNKQNITVNEFGVLETKLILDISKLFFRSTASKRRQGNLYEYSQLVSNMMKIFKEVSMIAPSMVQAC